MGENHTSSKGGIESLTESWLRNTMGQKIHPIGFRIGVNRDPDSKWYADKNYPRFLTEDYTIRKMVMKRKGWDNAAIAKIEIERQANQIKVTLHTAKPGIIIGRGGAGIDLLKADLEKLSGKTVHVNVAEIRHLESNAQLVSESIAQQIEKRIGYKRAMRQAVTRAMKLGVRGIRCQVSGRLGGAEMARREQDRQGKIPLQTLRADIDYGFDEALTQYGHIGIKVWIYKGDILPGARRQVEAPAPRQERNDRRDRRDRGDRDGGRDGGRGGRDGGGGGRRGGLGESELRPHRSGQSRLDSVTQERFSRTEGSVPSLAPPTSIVYTDVDMITPVPVLKHGRLSLDEARVPALEPIPNPSQVEHELPLDEGGEELSYVNVEWTGVRPPSFDVPLQTWSPGSLEERQLTVSQLPVLSGSGHRVLARLPGGEQFSGTLASRDSNSRMLNLTLVQDSHPKTPHFKSIRVQKRGHPQPEKEALVQVRVWSGGRESGEWVSLLRWDSSLPLAAVDEWAITLKSLPFDKNHFLQLSETGRCPVNVRLPGGESGCVVTFVASPDGGCRAIIRLNHPDAEAILAYYWRGMLMEAHALAMAISHKAATDLETDPLALVVAAMVLLSSAEEVARNTAHFRHWIDKLPEVYPTFSDGLVVAAGFYALKGEKERALELLHRWYKGGAGQPLFDLNFRMAMRLLSEIRPSDNPLQVAWLEDLHQSLMPVALYRIPGNSYCAVTGLSPQEPDHLLIETDAALQGAVSIIVPLSGAV